MRKDKIDFIVKYISYYRGCHIMYSLKFFFCEVLSFTEQDSSLRPDPMAVVFPKVTKCTFRKYGASGTIENHDGLCVLPLNIINEKIYTFLWFWFIVVLAITGLYLIYSAFILL